MRTIGFRVVVKGILIVLSAVSFSAAGASGKEETVHESICRLIEESAQKTGLPRAFLTRLIWQESAFRADAVSRAGAQGVAQFMPGTAEERGLKNPFDPEQAIPAAAKLLSDLQTRFGSLGLAAAAYNAGSQRVSHWMSGRGGLPVETRDYVASVTGRIVEDWRMADTPAYEKEQRPCLEITASLQKGGPRVAANLQEGSSRIATLSAPFAPWGVQLSANFSKDLALAAYERVRRSYADVLAGIQPMIIGTRVHSRGTKPFYRVRAPASSQEAANTLCAKLQKAGGACLVLKS